MVGEEALGEGEGRGVSVRVGIRVRTAQDGHVERVQHKDAPAGVDVDGIVDTRGRGRERGCGRTKGEEEAQVASSRVIVIIAIVITPYLSLSVPGSSFAPFLRSNRSLALVISSGMPPRAKLYSSWFPMQLNTEQGGPRPSTLALTFAWESRSNTAEKLEDV